ncbi:MAG: DUF3794 domain-containing protein [Clostridia bacterium]|nr:DUF3794 domain-containing protein [Clostridia bacterium]
MENKYDSVPVLKKIKCDAQQAVLENNVALEDEEVAKVLSVATNIDLEQNPEMLVGECNLSGRVVLNVIYLTANGEINSQTAVSQFNYKLKNEKIDSSSKINAKAQIVGTQIDKIMGNQIKVVTTVNIDAMLIKNVNMQYLLEAGDGVYVKQAKQNVVSLKSQNCERFEEALSATVKDGVAKVLFVNAECLIKEYEAGTGFIAVSGELYTKVVYVNKQEIPELQTVNISTTFKHELDADGVTKDSNLEAFLHIVHEQIKVEIEENEQDSIINVSVPLVACNNEYIENGIMTVVDAYSVQDVISISSEEEMTCVNLKPEYVEGKIEGNVILTDNEPRVDKYLATTNVCNQVSNAYVSNGVLNVEGVVSANVVYLNDELGGLQSVEIEIPYVLDKKVDLPDNAVVEANVGLFDVDVMVKRGREIYFDAKAKALVNITLENSLCMVTKAEDLEKLPERDSALEIYFAKAGESFWNIAKNLKIPTEIIANQNANLVDPLEKDENIAIYYQKQRNVQNN